MERQYIITNEGYIVAEFVGIWMENELRNAATGLSERAVRLMFPEALDAWNARDDSRLAEADDLSALDEARSNMENERHWAMSRDEFLEEAMSLPDFRSLKTDEERNSARDLMVYFWTIGQKRPEGGGGFFV